MYKLVVFDVAGTTVSDDGVVISAFEQAFTKVVPERWANESQAFISYAQKTMGQSKIEVFEHLLGSRDLAADAADAFQESYVEKLELVKPIPGVEKLFKTLRQEGVLIALNTGFNRATLDRMIEVLGWSDYLDATATPSETGVGRPSPAMLKLVASQLGVEDPKTVAVFGDTATDIETARRFGAGLKVGVLSGAHSEQELEEADADLIVKDVTFAVGELLD